MLFPPITSYLILKLTVENIDEKEFVPLQYEIPPESLGKFKINQFRKALNTEKICSVGYYFSKGPKTFD